jgi:kynurenine formamidase
VAPAVVVDIRDKAAADPDTALTVDDLRAWEASHGRIPEGAAVLLQSGWASRINDVNAMRNIGPDKRLHFPGYSVEAAQFLLAERSIVGMGTDALSTDLGINETFDVHRIASAANKWMLESVANLDAIPPAGAHLFVGAPKHVRGSGGPVRLIAVW